MRTEFMGISERREAQGRPTGSPPRGAWILALGAVGLSALFVLAVALSRGLRPLSAIAALMLVAAACSLLIIILVVPWANPGVRIWSRLLMAAALATAGILHFVLIREHAEESALLGYGFLVAGSVQLLLALVFLIRPVRLAAYAVIGVNAALLFLYVVHVYLGLPLSAAAPRAVLGTREEIDLPGMITKLAELVSLVLGFVTLAVARREE